MEEPSSLPLARWARTAGQCLLMPTVASRGLAFGRRPGSRLFLLGQALSWVGDVALTRRERGAFLGGVCAFLAAQVAYVAAYRTRSSQPLLATKGRRRGLAVGTAASVGMGLAAGRFDPIMGLPIAAYGVTLTTMVVSADAVDADRGRNRLLAGACLFLVSDTIIATRKFVTADRAAALVVAVAATYTAGQCCISDGMLRG